MSTDLKIVTGKARLSFKQNLFAPDDKGSYSLLMLIPKTDTDTVNKIKASIEAYKTNPKAVNIWGSKFLASFKTPLRDGDTERDTEKNPEYKGHYFLNANTYNKPGVVDAQKNEILDKKEVYSGCYGRASLVPSAYNVDGNKGIKFYLNNVQKLGDGEPLGGAVSRAEDDFTAVDDDFLA